jgi:membrane protein required for beta-lactamase induction
MLTQNQMVWVNHMFFASLLVWFLALQGTLTPITIQYAPSDVYKALHYQPRTPPPVFDPEGADASTEATDLDWMTF